VRVLWAPWRLSYIEQQPSTASSGCIFCLNPAKTSAEARRDTLVLLAGHDAAVLMNRYPYANAHLMVAPRVHTADFAGLDARTAGAVQSALQLAVGVLQKAYSPGGFNIGVNLGRVAGAGIADHLHWHVVPRWQGDTNFMPMFAETRIINEHLYDAYDRLLPLFQEAVS
jgi:ATP adenylyltransferase